MIGADSYDVSVTRTFLIQDICGRYKMTCQLCLVAGVFTVIMVLCWLTHEKKEIPSDAPKSEDEKPAAAPMVAINRNSYEEIRPPITGPVQKQYEVAPASRYDERKYLELPRGGLSCANKRWYDSIYNGGSETLLELPKDGERDVTSLWEEDATVRRRELRRELSVPDQTHTMYV
jgi:hypothetical protein